MGMLDLLHVGQYYIHIHIRNDEDDGSFCMHAIYTISHLVDFDVHSWWQNAWCVDCDFHASNDPLVHTIHTHSLEVWRRSDIYEASTCRCEHHCAGYSGRTHSYAVAVRFACFRHTNILKTKSIYVYISIPLAHTSWASSSSSSVYPGQRKGYCRDKKHFYVATTSSSFLK